MKRQRIYSFYVPQTGELRNLRDLVIVIRVAGIVIEGDRGVIGYA
jgi:hypothetical protein